MKYIRWLCLLYFKLILMLINWNIILGQRNQLFNTSGKLLSLNKCYQTMMDNLYRLRNAISWGIEGIADFILWASWALQENHWLEKKKNSLGLEKILRL